MDQGDFRDFVVDWVDGGRENLDQVVAFWGRVGG